MSSTHEKAEADHEARKQREPLALADPQSHRDDGSPVAGDGQVYVTRTGKRFHPQWCSIMAAHWRDNHGGIYVTMMADVGMRQRCPQCDRAPKMKAGQAARKQPLVRVDPLSHRDDGAPVAGEGQAYVTRTGKLFHTQWCPIMAAHWRDSKGGVYVTMMADVDPRGRCTQCDTDPEVMEHFKFERGEWVRLNEELDRLGRIIARTLVAKGPEGVNQLGPHVIRFRETEADLKSCPAVSQASSRTRTKLRTGRFWEQQLGLFAQHSHVRPG